MTDTTQMDAEANQFAMELLMPAKFLLRDVERLGGVDIDDDGKVKRLAVKYKVSHNVMVLRLGQLSKRIFAR